MGTFVASFTHLKDRPKAGQALLMLQRTASLVKPIMRKHDWKLPVLAEFFPENANLVGLNVNAGQKILLRLRPAWAPDTFYDDDQLVRVMLHELTHNVHGPHNEQFYKFLAGLEEEYDTLKRSGYAGEGFYSKGSRLGVDVSHNLPHHLARVKALEAAERRRQVSIMMNGGRQLGTESIGKALKNMTPRELAAEAAERRARDEKMCGTTGSIDTQMEAERTAKKSPVIDVIDLNARHNHLTQRADKYKEKPNNLRQTTASTTASRLEILLPNRTDAIRASRSKAHHQPKSSLLTAPGRTAKSTSHPIDSDSYWTCPACTLLNLEPALQCSACLSERPTSSDGWTCLTCGEMSIPHEFWSCRFCGNIKRESILG